jgi:hypothetical protein
MEFKDSCDRLGCIVDVYIVGSLNRIDVEEWGESTGSADRSRVGYPRASYRGTGIVPECPAYALLGPGASPYGPDPKPEPFVGDSVSTLNQPFPPPSLLFFFFRTSDNPLDLPLDTESAGDG